MPGHCDPLNEARRAYGLPPLPRELRRVYTDADAVAYADIPEFFPLDDAPPAHRHIGPILWSPPVTPPGWWFEERDRADPRPAVYLSMGSSGDDRLLGRLVDATLAAGARAWVATAGRPFDAGGRDGVHVANWLPGVEAARCADLVVCNGGSLATQQALCAGTPVLGIAQNMDQFLNMAPLVAAGVGRVVRADRVSPRSLGEALSALLRSDAVRAAAARSSSIAGRCAAGPRFVEFAREILGERPLPASAVAARPETESASAPTGVQHAQDPAQPDPHVRLPVHARRDAVVADVPPDA
jgi:UDP:flavonoid glycosyltransferase YjiC (YdhE family)